MLTTTACGRRPPSLVVVLTSALLSACTCNGHVPDDVDSDRLCGAVAAAPIRGDPAVTVQIARQFGIDPHRLRWDQNGVFVPRSTFFVEERGIFFARPGVDLREAYEPSFTPVRRCLYRYRIAG